MIGEIPAEKAAEADPDRGEKSHRRLELMAKEAIQNEKSEPTP